MKDLFPDPFFFLALDKDASVSSYLGSSMIEGMCYRNPHLILAFQDWELEFVTNFFYMNYNFPSNRGGDKMYWSLPQSSKFEVRLFCDAFRGHVGLMFPWKSTWATQVPWKGFFLSIGKDFNHRLSSKEELLNHRLVLNMHKYCKATWSSFTLLFVGKRDLIICVFLFDAFWVMPNMIQHLLWQGKFCSRKSIKILNVVHLCVIWIFWWRKISQMLVVLNFLSMLLSFYL